MFIGVCVLIRRYYARVRGLLANLDETLTNLPFSAPAAERELDPQGPTAVVLVAGYDGLGIHTLLSVQRLFPRYFKNWVFVSVGVVDSGQFKGADSIASLEHKVQEDLGQYVGMAQRMGYYAEYRYTLGTDPIEELEGLCRNLVPEFRAVTVFAGQLVFQRVNPFTRMLHQETAFAIQRRLQFAGIQIVILPIRVWERRKRTPAA